MQPGDTITVHVTPKASRARIIEGPEGLRVYVTVVPENGKANAEVQKLLAKHLGVPKSSLTLIRGDKSRDKTFQFG
ncbi:MAG TPA: hypothetical protein DFI00_04580 [Rhodospirillaceae bacterium]|nr:hypothetical protein [Alphaproteobacteria bacterium]OUT40866.1 MAG: hypothetical protein CBB62_00390 [Micavibrio sp. TMED2]HCI46546.1 hypothetical protein [Rhodospirillaceae bacterium]MAS47654.1 hypothetical protein [Alphaproteobacteria bacterium]MAX96474.1 hypothetical protein [Alphaproteobacteria bacterium]|tara:strand:+ start:12183 stop:12410 length:228 start_codon:yes stop_codon:yes gene_type:complete